MAWYNDRDTTFGSLFNYGDLSNAGRMDNVNFELNNLITNNPEYFGTDPIAGGNGAMDWLNKDSKFMQGMGGLSSLIGIGKDAFNIWNMFDERSLANEQWDTMKKYAALNAGNQGARLAYSMGANNAALDSAAGRPVNIDYMNEANNIKSSIG